MFTVLIKMHSVLMFQCSFRIVSEDGVAAVRRRRDTSPGTTSTTTTTITLEFGDPPEVNVTQPSTPSVSQEIQQAGEEDDSVDIVVSVQPLSTSSLTHSLV